MSLWPRLRRTRTFTIKIGDELPPEVLAAFDQRQARVRNGYDNYLRSLTEIAETCPCGEPVDGPKHAMAFQSQLAQMTSGTLAALLLEGLLRDVARRTKTERADQ